MQTELKSGRSFYLNRNGIIHHHTLPQVRAIGNETAITGVIFPKYYTLDDPNVTVTILLNDISQIQSLKINSKGIIKQDKQLIIENSNVVETISMRSGTELKLPEGIHLLKFHYGNEDYIKDQLMESSARIGNVYPNPIKKSDKFVSTSVSLPEGDNEVSLRLKNLLGQEINFSKPEQYQGGRRNISWQSDFSQLPSGLYLLQIEVNDAKGIVSLSTRRIIFE